MDIGLWFCNNIFRLPSILGTSDPMTRTKQLQLTTHKVGTKMGLAWGALCLYPYHYWITSWPLSLPTNSLRLIRLSIGLLSPSYSRQTISGPSNLTSADDWLNPPLPRSNSPLLLPRCSLRLICESHHSSEPLRHLANKTWPWSVSSSLTSCDDSQKDMSKIWSGFGEGCGCMVQVVRQAKFDNRVSDWEFSNGGIDVVVGKVKKGGGGWGAFTWNIYYLFAPALLQSGKVPPAFESYLRSSAVTHDSGCYFHSGHVVLMHSVRGNMQ